MPIARSFSTTRPYPLLTALNAGDTEDRLAPACEGTRRIPKVKPSVLLEGKPLRRAAQKELGLLRGGFRQHSPPSVKVAGYKFAHQAQTSIPEETENYTSVVHDTIHYRSNTAPETRLSFGVSQKLRERTPVICAGEEDEDDTFDKDTIDPETKPC
ncbi:hypothetical protein C8Q78DRAFT_995252 [Trametes maxima]|nr:hypothetical protein C8Q78DRAFT_995252 [Trametes maxima]